MKTTVNELRRALCETLTPSTDEASVLADMIISFALCTDRATLLTLTDVQVDEQTVIICEDMVRRFIGGTPVQYIFGECYFAGHPVKIGSGCFIPRSDTEVLAAAAVALLPENGSFADICCGSGCISLAVASERPDAKGLALDYYPKPLSFSEENLKDCKNVSVRRFDALDAQEYASVGKLDMILSNPPYIPTEDIDFLDTHVQCEPRTALDGGEDGLRFYRAIIEYGKGYLNENGRFLFEVGYDQAQSVCELLEKAGFNAHTKQDLGGIERLVYTD
ncbi:MAG TPA: peptide chain release factor N(5)-glutamine methyltransferase [Bacillota bacterium]|nr:peptide chain release factor N(5)-glutamine methyltransferase [Bacillota bacterium]